MSAFIETKRCKSVSTKRYASSSSCSCICYQNYSSSDILEEPLAINCAMRLLRHIRSRSRFREPQKAPEAVVYPNSNHNELQGPAPGLPARVLDTIFTFVCPHTREDSYTSCEDSMTEEGCMLCDSRDLARCSLVCKSWSLEAQKAL